VGASRLGQLQRRVESQGLAEGQLGTSTIVSCGGHHTEFEVKPSHCRAARLARSEELVGLTLARLEITLAYESLNLRQRAAGVCARMRAEGEKESDDPNAQGSRAPRRARGPAM
jgi:hypothetical protein